MQRFTTTSKGVPLKQGQLDQKLRIPLALWAAAISISAWCLVMGIPGLEELLPFRIDLAVYRAGAQAAADGRDLYGALPGLDLVFTYPPFAALVFQPLGWLPAQAANLLFAMVSLAALACLILVSAKAGGTQAKVALGPLLLGGMWLFPVRQTFGYGQINLVLAALIACDLLLLRKSKFQGLLTGFACAIKLTPLVFLGYFLARRNWFALLASIGSFFVLTGMSFLLLRDDSEFFWSQAILQTKRVGDQYITTNQAVSGLLWRSGLESSAVWLGVVSLLALVVTVLATRTAKVVGDLELVSVFALLGLLISPISWTHHWVWCIPPLLALGKWSRRKQGTLATWWLIIGCIIFAVHPGRFAPFTQAQPYPWWQQIIGSAMAIWALGFLVLFAWVAKSFDSRSDCSAELRSGL